MTHEPFDRQRPIVRINPGHSEVAKHDRIFGARDAIDKLMGLERMAPKGASWIEQGKSHFESPVALLRRATSNLCCDVL
jgi:hypothetical protein